MEQMVDLKVPTLYKAKLNTLPIEAEDLVFRLDGKIFIDIGRIHRIMFDGSLGEEVQMDTNTVVEFVDICDQAPLGAPFDFMRRQPQHSKVGLPAPKWAIAA